MFLKDVLRRKLIEKRKHYDRWFEDSQNIEEKFFSLEEVIKSSVFLLYYPHKNEVNTLNILNRLLSEGKTVLLPKVEGKHILPVKITDINSVSTGYAGIKEPEGGQVYRSDIDVIVVPAVAFDEKGYRLGYGKGFYDKFLSNQNALKIGLAYDFQVLKEIPRDLHDIPVDIVITPTKIIRTKEE